MSHDSEHTGDSFAKLVELGGDHERKALHDQPVRTDDAVTPAQIEKSWAVTKAGLKDSFAPTDGDLSGIEEGLLTVSLTNKFWEPIELNLSKGITLDWLDENIAQGVSRPNKEDLARLNEIAETYSELAALERDHIALLMSKALATYWESGSYDRTHRPSKTRVRATPPGADTPKGSYWFRTTDISPDGNWQVYLTFDSGNYPELEEFVSAVDLSIQEGFEGEFFGYLAARGIGKKTDKF
ncbi:MAG: hypothetical protein GY930_14700 [bacterium]|nr:hypothetical protein [bacterium]